MPKELGSLSIRSAIEVAVKPEYRSQLGDCVVFYIADKNHGGYPADSVTLMTLGVIQMMSWDAREPTNSNGDRQLYGNNTYARSNLHQWLNSSATEGKWFSPQHNSDAPPTNANVDGGVDGYDTRAGFLYMLDPKFVGELKATSVVSAIPNFDGGGQQYISAKMFLASAAEVGASSYGHINEGSRLPVFTNQSSTSAVLTVAAAENYKGAFLSPGAAVFWWLRTPANDSSSNVAESGGAHYNWDSGVAWCERGVRPLCNLRSSILISDTQNSRGCYEIIYNSPPSAPGGIPTPATVLSGQNINISCFGASDPDGDALNYVFERSANGGSWAQVKNSSSRNFSELVSTAWNTLQYRVKAVDSMGQNSPYTTSGTITVIHNQPPVISGKNTDIGAKHKDFVHEYSITDAELDIVNVTEKLDGKTIETKNAITLGDTLTVRIGGHTFTSLLNGEHTITLTATDSHGNSATRTLTFTKSALDFVIALSEPLISEKQPTRCNIAVNRDIPAGGTFKVEVTNNPYDDSPTWEDCTNTVIQGNAHVFTNTVNEATGYGINIRVTVDRGGSIQTCWVSGIGGNFE